MNLRFAQGAKIGNDIIAVYIMHLEVAFAYSTRFHCSVRGLCV